MVFLRTAFMALGALSLSAAAGASDRSGAVDIVRDANGVPHIFGQDSQAAAFGLGFAHAQDRLWQMEMNRRKGRGRVAEVFGEAAVPADTYMRTLGLARAASTALAKLDSDTQAWLRAYADGVNAFIAGRPDLPPQFVANALTPERWTPEDSVLILKLVALELAGNWQSEAERAHLMTRLRRDQVDDFLINEFPGPHTLPDLKTLYDGAMLRDVAALKPARPDGLGSNNWVVGPSRSVTGKPLLADDPHLGLSAPTFFYLAHLSFGANDQVGSTIAGMPGVVVGHNGKIAWGVTDTAPDVQDLFVEKIDPARPGRYRTPQGWADFVVRPETIVVRGGKPVTIQVRATRHGPVLSDLRPALAEASPDSVVALAWTSLFDEDSTMKAVRTMGNSGDAAAFRTALRDWKAPQLSFLYADTKGDIGLLAPGLVPIRNRNNLVEGQLPVPGWDATYDWTGFIPFDGLPHVENPKSGALWTANSKIVDADYPYLITREWPLSHRARRIAELLASKPQHSMASFRAMQADVVSLRTKELLAPMLASLPTGAKHGEIVAAMKAWDWSYPIDRPEPSIFAVWYSHLVDLLYADEFGDLFSDYRSQNPLFIRHVLTNAEAGARWCDNIGTPTKESCGEIVAKALDQAIASLTQTSGADWKKWRWGDLHQARAPGGLAPGDKEGRDIVIPAPGGEGTVNVGSYNINAARPYDMKSAAVFRALFDLADLSRSEFILQTGNSGDPRSPHYADMNEPWRDVRYIRIETDRATLERSGAKSLKVRR